MDESSIEYEAGWEDACKKILRILEEKLKSQDLATDKYLYRCGIHDCIEIVKKIQRTHKVKKIKNVKDVRNVRE